MGKLGIFENWFPLAHLNTGDLVQHRTISGVYAMRLAATGEILYIGSSNNLRRRIFGNYLGGVGGETTQRIHELLFAEGQITRVELAWIEVDEYRDKEAELKEEYRKKHGHLPRWNKL
jgi:excinuclease UvrABC nuclease subunit